MRSLPWPLDTTRNTTRNLQGFSLIEVLVAFVIMTLSLGALYSLQTASTRAVALAKDYAIVSDLARSLLAEQAIWQEPTGDYDGTHDGKYHWVVNYQPYVPDNDEISMLSLRKIDIDIHWHTAGTQSSQPRVLHLTALRPHSRERGGL